VAQSTGLQHKQVYLNSWFFCLRAAAYFLFWLSFQVCMDRWSRRQDQTGDQRFAHAMSRLSGPGLVTYGITITFAAVDWIMSLQPAFHSTIFGPVVASGQLLSGQALALMFLGWFGTQPPLDRFLVGDTLNDLGNLLFTFLVIWAYLVFFQFMLIWMGNLQTDASWYMPRGEGGWYWVSWALGVFHFGVPFFLLLSRDIKRNPRALAAVAALVLFMQLVFCDYQVLPSFPAPTLAAHWMDFLMPLGLGGLWLAHFSWELTRLPLLPRQDPNAASAERWRAIDTEEAAREREVQHG
jgi:hypothetical protein